MIITKPKLSLEGQIEHLKKKGVLFNIMNEESAKEYLTQHNNYFKLTAYRKNYDKHPDGENKGKYINLEFAYLVDLAVIDMRLRYRIVHMALDIEHHTKLQLLRMMDKFNEDGYQIVQDYMDSLSEVQRKNVRPLAAQGEGKRDETAFLPAAGCLHDGFPLRLRERPRKGRRK